MPSASPGVTVYVRTAMVLGLAFIGLGLYELHAGAVAEAALDLSGAQITSRRAELAAAQSKIVAADQTLVALRQRVDRLSGAPAPGPARGAGSGAGNPLAVSRADWPRLVAAYPAAHDLVKAVGKAQLEAKYALFFQQSGLTAAQLQAFENRLLDVMVDSTAVGPNAIHPTVSELPPDEARAALGDQGYQELQDYNRRLPANNVASAIFADSAAGGAPISVEQEAQVAQAIADSNAAYRNGQAMAPGQVDWGNAETQAQTILTPAQWQAVSGVFLTLQYQQALAQAQAQRK